MITFITYHQMHCLCEVCYRRSVGGPGQCEDISCSCNILRKTVTTRTVPGRGHGAYHYDGDYDSMYWWITVTVISDFTKPNTVFLLCSYFTYNTLLQYLAPIIITNIFNIFTDTAQWLHNRTVATPSHSGYTITQWLHHRTVATPSDVRLGGVGATAQNPLSSRVEV